MPRHERLLRLALACALLLIASAEAYAQDTGLEIIDHHQVLRPALPWRVRFRLREDAPANRDLVVQVALYDEHQIIALHDLDIDNPAELTRPVTAHLTPPWELAQHPMTVEISISGRGWQRSTRLEVTTYPSLLARAQAATMALQATQTQAPLPWLWAEEISSISNRPPRMATVKRIRDLTRRLQAWPIDEDALRQLRTRALRCRADGSVQPYRVYPGGSNDDPVVHVMADAPDASKHRWRSSAAPWLVTAREADYAIVEWYPAGDTEWHGIAAQRVINHWQDLIKHHGWQDRPNVVMGIGRGAAGALALARRQPLAIRAALLIQPRLGHSQALWPQLEMVPIAVLGDGNAAFDQLRRRHASARDLWLRLDGDDQRTPDPDSLRPWQWLRLRAQDATPAPPWRFQVDRPGDYGPIRVHALTDWSLPGHLAIDAVGDHLQVRAENLLALQWRDPTPPALMAGQPLNTMPPPRPAGPSKTWGRATGPLRSFTDNPFTVIIGRGDSAAAARDNQTLARAFLEDWRDHAQGLPPWHDEDDLNDGLPEGHHLILIGNPLSHRLLGRLLQETRSTLPVSWDALHLQHGTLRLRRGRGAGLALAWPHPRDPSRLMIILDGAPVWTRHQAPLLDLEVDMRLLDDDGRHHDTTFDGRWTRR